MGRWPRGGRGLERASGWRDLLLVFRSGAGRCAGVVCCSPREVSGAGSSVALACRPLAFWLAIRVVRVDGRGSVSSGVPMWDPRRPRPSARGPGRFERHMDVEADPAGRRWVRVGSSTLIVLKVTRTAATWCGASGGELFTTRRPGPARAPAQSETGPGPGTKWRRRNGSRARRRSSVSAPGTSTGNIPVWARRCPGRRSRPRMRCERVGRAVICDVAIRAAPVRCPHKRTPDHAPHFHPAPQTTRAWRDRHGAPTIQPRPHPDPLLAGVRSWPCAFGR